MVLPDAVAAATNKARRGATLHALSSARCKGLALVQEAEQRQPFDMLYFDGLGRQDMLVRLTISPGKGGAAPAKSGRLLDNPPPLEMVIATLWPGAKVDWNASEVLL
jgi:hypothetical protein